MYTDEIRLHQKIDKLTVVNKQIRFLCKWSGMISKREKKCYVGFVLWFHISLGNTPIFANYLFMSYAVETFKKGAIFGIFKF